MPPNKGPWPQQKVLTTYNERELQQESIDKKTPNAICMAMFYVYILYVTLHKIYVLRFKTGSADVICGVFGAFYVGSGIGSSSVRIIREDDDRDGISDNDDYETYID